MAIETQKYESLRTSEKQVARASYESSSTLADLEVLHDLDFLPEKASQWRGRSLSDYMTKLATSRYIWLLHMLLLLTSSTLFLVSCYLPCTTLSHVQKYSAWSPAAGAVGYEEQVYNITRDNKFVGAGPEVDKAWREISYDMGDQWVPKAALPKLGEESSLLVDHPVTGEEGYRVGMEVFHQLHCLNLLRRVTYKDYYEPLGGEFGKGPEALQRHTDHCLEVLRLNLQCNADIGLFTFYMVEGDPLAWPQLNSKHVCRNFENVRQWALDNSVGNMEVIE
jgi:hypothetical protein